MAIATPAAARDVSNSSQTMVQMQGYWSSYDDATGAWEDASVYVTDHSGETFIEYSRFRSTPITCPDGLPGQHIEWLSGYGTGTLEANKDYTSGLAAATVTGWMDTYDVCETGEEVVVPENGGGGDTVTFDVSASFTSTSPLNRERGSGSFKIPGEYNSHNSYSSTYRYGELDVTVDGQTSSGWWGQLGKVSWRNHSNSK
ncbi:MAG: hypothetical protein OER95_08870 [Acidimicrobiia bacterium]|nr:hypothetical protein [Acidimicrobiia bacterium]